MVQQKQRYVWIDYMKVYGLYFIVLGHFFPTYSSYIYAFSVPLFFIVSGALSKKEHDFKTFMNKSLYNLIIPFGIIVMIQYVWDSVMHPDIVGGRIKTVERFANAIIGNVSGAGTCWFVYTLFVLKLLHQTLSKQILRVLLLVLPMTAVLLIHNDIAPGNSILNATVAYPFYWVGMFLNQRLDKLTNVNIGKTTYVSVCISLVVLIVVGRLNWLPWIHVNAYGRYLLLYIIGGLAGTYIIYFMSILSDRYFGMNKYIQLLSVGSIVILGFHNTVIIDFIHQCNIGIDDYNAILYSFGIMLLFIPINMFFEKYLPIIYGKRLRRQ